MKRNYVGGRDILDPQYADYPADISPADKQKYFDPILVQMQRGGQHRGSSGTGPSPSNSPLLKKLGSKGIYLLNIK